MPALRKRKSRTNTPYDTPNDTPPHDPDVKRMKTQSSLDGWIEPPPKNPAPSFEEHGFARHGVLETMAPLGVPPSSKVKTQARTLFEEFFHSKKGNTISGEEGASTPEVTPAPELEREDSEMQEEDEIPAAIQMEDEDEDDEYVPSKSKAKANVAKTPVRGKTPVLSKTPIYNKTPVKNGTSRAPTAAPSPATQSAPPQIHDDATKQRTQIAVLAAIDRSNTTGKRSIGAALKDLWQDSRSNNSLAESLHSVMQQSASADQYQVFKNYIKTKKKAFKQEAKTLLRREERNEQAVQQTGEEAAESPSFPAESGSTLPEATTAKSPTKATSAVQDPELTAQAASQSHNTTDLNIEDAPPIEEAHTERDPAQTAPHPFATAPTLPATESSSPPASEMASKSPRKQQTLSENALPDSVMDVDVEPSTNAPTPAAKTPDSGDSDLSDVNEEIVQNGPPEPVKANGNSAAVVPKKARNAALARAGKKSRANSAKPNGRYEKKAPPSAEELVEQGELQKKRQAMVEQQPSHKPYNPPTSEVRFDDEMDETESLTESQIELGPPVGASQPRRAGRAPRKGGITLHIGKRGRDSNSALPSPQLNSAVTTRPSTPAIALPAAKRLKLNNGQAARTKRSPVKNRDGPIAGIAHSGGGGSRQLGPDDNAPGSPPSESDDLCAACKGAGEFVCCDACPRVFHFLCCDPPRTEAPRGSFLCFECTIKHKPAEDPAESFAILGPLFKQLDNTNTRAFALPTDIQNYFENVSARPDGSYFEEVKKFPLSKSSGYGYQKPDYFKTVDSDHKVILCSSCGKSSGGKRPMLKCDFCSTHWHLDCCDPPLANPPHISLDASHRDAWRCPRHIDHDLRAGYLLQNDLNEVYDENVDMPDAAPIVRIARKVRKPRQVEVIEPTFSRGTRNNGLIEITNDPDDDTDGEGNYVYATDESKDLNSKVFRVPEKGVVLDFISKVKHGRIEQHKEARRAAKSAAKHKASWQHFAARPIQQQQAALNLAQLANKEKDIGLNERTVEALILGLTAEAPKEVVAAISAAGPAPATAEERAQLLQLQELISRRLNG